MTSTMAAEPVATHQKAQLFFRAQFLEDGALIGAGFEVSLMTGQLNPWIALLFVCLEEWCPLNDIPQLSPPWWLHKNEREITINKRKLFSVLITDGNIFQKWIAWSNSSVLFFPVCHCSSHISQTSLLPQASFTLLPFPTLSALHCSARAFVWVLHWQTSSKRSPTTIYCRQNVVPKTAKGNGKRPLMPLAARSMPTNKMRKRNAATQSET